MITLLKDLPLFTDYLLKGYYFQVTVAANHNGLLLLKLDFVLTKVLLAEQNYCLGVKNMN